MANTDFPNDLSGPAIDAVAITPSDSADLASPVRGIYVGTSGDVKVTLISGNAVVLKNLVAGVAHGLLVTRVWATGTSAANIVGII